MQTICEQILNETVHERYDFIDRSVLVGLFAEKHYTVEPAVTLAYANSTEVSLDEILASDILGGAILDGDRVLKRTLGSEADDYISFHFMVIRYNRKLQLHEDYLIRVGISKFSSAMTVAQVKLANRQEIDRYYSVIKAYGEQVGELEEYNSEFYIGPLMGISRVEISAYVADKIEGRHGLKLIDVLEGLNSKKRSKPEPYLERGIAIKDQIIVFSDGPGGRRIKVGLKRIQIDGEAAWKVLTAHFQ